MQNRTDVPSGSGSTPFHSGNQGGWSADFDQAYEALTPGSVRGSATTWTVHDGDTLQGIAAATWGDASLWYLIAEANGLTSGRDGADAAWDGADLLIWVIAGALPPGAEASVTRSRP